VWTATGGFSATLDPLWRIGAKISDDTCTICHAEHQPGYATANDWIGHVNAMRRLTPLKDNEVALLQAYLQNHAR
jgi:trimethylamine-N-oxide reductase cytochrome c-type subunit TorC